MSCWMYSTDLNCQVYLRQTPNDLTGEHTCVMIRPLENNSEGKEWLGAFSRDFKRRFLELLSYQFVYPNLNFAHIMNHAVSGNTDSMTDFGRSHPSWHSALMSMLYPPGMLHILLAFSISMPGNADLRINSQVCKHGLEAR